MLTDEFAQSLGFANVAEFHHLVSEVDITTPEKQARFKQWQVDDGSKLGLLALFPAPTVDQMRTAAVQAIQTKFLAHVRCQTTVPSVHPHRAHGVVTLKDGSEWEVKVERIK